MKMIITRKEKDFDEDTPTNNDENIKKDSNKKKKKNMISKIRD